MLRTIKTAVVLTGITICFLSANSVLAAAKGTAEATLNGLRITFDAETGSVVKLEYPGTGEILNTSPDYAGLVDLAYPCKDFEPLRLATRYSRNARIEKIDDQVTITWDKLGPSRPFDLEGKVAAKVKMKALPDGQSILMQCKIDNQSANPVRQVLFPDLIGLRPFAGEALTELRAGGFAIKPFEVLNPNLKGGFYPFKGADVLEFSGGSAFTEMITRWLNFGSLKGGISVFPKTWATTSVSKVRLHRTETHKTLRISWMHEVTVEAGEQWESPEYVFTPHELGWAKGIEPYRKWVHKNVKRIAPMTEHVRNGLGFRTLWMCKGYPADPEHDVAFKFTDLPKAARESKEHGLDEMVLWFWHPHFRVPTPPPFEHLGTEQQLAKAIEECKRMGVNVTLFISWRSLAEPDASRYGFEVGDSWDYHPEMVPRFHPPYVAGRATAFAVVSNKQYQKDVLDSAQYIIGNLSPSIGWDQVSDYSASFQLYKLLGQIRKMSLQADPQSSFSGESVRNVEKDADYLDYMWNWRVYGDVQAFTNAFPAPRINANINRNVKEVWQCFMDNIYMNIMPSLPDDANATAYIEDYPDLGRAIKSCAKLRSQFLPYFTQGTLIGDNILTEPVADAHVSAYLLPDKLLMMVMSESEKAQSFKLSCDLEPWIKSKTGSYDMHTYLMDGSFIGKPKVTGSSLHFDTASLENMEIAIYEFVRQ